MIPDGDQRVDASAGDIVGKHVQLGHDDDDPLEAEREAAAGVAAEKHADQAVVAAAAANDPARSGTLISMIVPV